MLRLGFIGAGAIAEVHAEAAQRAGSQVAGFFDVSEDRARLLADRFQASVATTSLETLLKSACDACVVAVPNFLHRDMALAVIRAGKDLLLEKPMALSLAECDQIIDAASAHGSIVMINFVCRSSPAALLARELIDAGRLGSIYHIKAANIRRRGIPGLGRWFTTKSQSGGGVLIDIGIHMIDLAMHLGRAEAVERASGHCTSLFGSPIADYRYREMWAGPPRLDGVFDVEDGAVALLRLSRGITLELNVTWAANVSEASVRNGMTLLGDRGGCHLDVWGADLTLTTHEAGDIVDLKPPLPDVATAWPMAWQRQHELFARAVRDRVQPEASMACGRAVQAAVEALYRSSELRQEVAVE